MRQNRGGGMGIQPLVTAWAQILIGGRMNTEPRNLPLYFSSCLKREVGAGGERGGREGGGGSCLIRVLAAKHLPCSSPTPIHITPVLLHP